MVTARQKKITEIHPTFKDQHDHQEQTKGKKRKGLIRRLSALGVFIALLATFTMVTIHSQASLIEEKELEKKALEGQLANLQLQERDLHQEIENYNDLEYIAEIARRDYFLSKPGETIFKLPTSSVD